MENFTLKGTRRDLLINGIPNLSFQSNGFDETETNERNNFGMLQNLEDMFDDKLYHISMTLLGLERMNSFDFDEAYNVRDTVSNIVRDICYSARSYKPSVFLFEDGYNFYIIDKTRPLMIIRTNSLRRSWFMRDQTTLTGSTNSLLEFHHYYGLRDVVSISSNVKQWELHWLKSNQAYAEAIQVEEWHDHCVERVTTADTTTVRSGILHYQDPDLLKMVASAVMKCLHSPYIAVSLTDAERLYLVLDKDDWTWAKLDLTNVHELTFHLSRKVTKSKKFTAVKYYQHFYQRFYASVWLALGSGTNSLVVIKECDSKDEATQENNIWVKVYGAASSFVTTLRRKPVVVMPFTVTTKLMKVNDKGEMAEVFAGGEVVFDFDLRSWVTCRGATASDNPAPGLVALHAAMKAAAAPWMDPRVAATVAIKKLAEHCIVHEDLEWRHVALKPVFHTASGRLLSMSPVLIDFGRTGQRSTAGEALQEMTNQLRSLMGPHDWSRYDTN